MLGDPLIPPRFGRIRMGANNQGEQKMIGNDRRIYPRAEVQWPVSAMTAEGTIHGETRNLSMLGAFISCTKPLSSNEIVALTINIPDTHHSLTVRAQVVWSYVCPSEDKSCANGMGVKFIWHWPAVIPPSQSNWREGRTHLAE